MNYKIDYLDFGDGRPLMHFTIEENQVLDTFFATDVLQFSDLLVRTINKVLKDKSSLEDCSFNQCSVRIEKDKTVIEDVYADDASKTSHYPAQAGSSATPSSGCSFAAPATPGF